MASDSITEQREELEAALAEIEPQIKGCQKMINDDISPDLRASYQERLTFLQDREAKIKAVLASMDGSNSAWDVLEDDGFPELPPMEVPASQYQEIQEEGAATDAAAAGFVAIPMASTMTVTLGTPVDKP